MDGRQAVDGADGRRTVAIYDTTLRDGCQGSGVSLTTEDKLKIARALDRLGVAYIEGGWPASNPKDTEFFARVKDLDLRRAKMAAFGSTRRAGVAWSYPWYGPVS